MTSKVDRSQLLLVSLASFLLVLLLDSVLVILSDSAGVDVTVSSTLLLVILAF